MTLPFGRQHRLVSRGCAGLTFDDDGLALGSVSIAVLERGAHLPRRCHSRSADEISRALRLAYEAASEATILRYREGLQRVVTLLEAGDIGRAGVHAVLLGLPEISPDGMAKLAAAEGLCKIGPVDEPRLSSGQAGAGEWTSGGDGVASAGSKTDESGQARLQYVDIKGATPAEKAAYVQTHLAAAIAGGKALGIPPENILGLSALESSWGRGKFAVHPNNNFFNMHSPALYQTGATESDGGTWVSTFSSYADGMRSFIHASGNTVRGKSDPEEFARALQDSKKFGINPDGSKVPTFVHGTARTIVGIRKLIEASKSKNVI